jgi:hypothetical protein
MDSSASTTLVRGIVVTISTVEVARKSGSTLDRVAMRWSMTSRGTLSRTTASKQS